MNEDAYEKIAVIENIIEAQVVADILEQAQIPHRIRSYHDTAYDGLFQFQNGWGALLAPSAHRSRILVLLDQLRKGGTSDRSIG